MAVNNTLTSVVPTLFAQGMGALRHNCVMPRLVNYDWGNEVKKKGDTIQVPLPSAMAVSAVVPGAYAPDPQNVAPTTATIPLTNWYESPFTLTEQEIAKAVEGVVPIQLTAAVEAMAAYINSTIFALHTGVYGFTGTAGTTPFAADVTAATNARKALAQQLAPTNSRRLVMDPNAEANALALPAFYAGYSSGDKAVMAEGQIGRKFGFDMYMDQQVPTHTAGTITTGLTATGVNPVGATAINCTTAVSTGACALLIGDIVTFSGDAQTYTLTANATQASANTAVVLTVSPPKVVATAGGETVTVKATHLVNLAFHRDAFAFASRPLTSEVLDADPTQSYTDVDPVSGIAMRLSYRPEFHRTRWAFDVLWGVGLIRPQLAVRIAG